MPPSSKNRRTLFLGENLLKLIFFLNCFNQSQMSRWWYCNNLSVARPRLCSLCPPKWVFWTAWSEY